MNTFCMVKALCCSVCTHVAPDPTLRQIEEMTTVLPRRPEEESEEGEKVPAAAAPISQAMAADRELEVAEQLQRAVLMQVAALEQKQDSPVARRPLSPAKPFFRCFFLTIHMCECQIHPSTTF